MLKRFYTFTSTSVSIALGIAVIQTSPAQAFDFTFSQDFGSAGTLTGEFAGTDTNGNGQLDASEFTSFTSIFQGSEPGFENFSWGLSNLVSSSFFVAPNYYSLLVTDTASSVLDSRGWRSNTLLGETIVGFAPSQNIVARRYFSQNALSFGNSSEAVPEPTTIAGLTVAGLGMLYARRRQKRRAKFSKQ